MLDTLLKSLNIDPMVILLNGVLFLVLLFILDKSFWKPMLTHLDNRKKEVTSAYQAIDNTRTELEKLRAEYQVRLNGIEAEARGQIQTTVRDAQAQREAMIAAAREQSEQMVKDGTVAILKESDESLAAMRGSLDTVASDTLAKALGIPVKDSQRKLVDEYIAKQTARN